MNTSVPEDIKFVHVVLEGTPYEIGRKQGELLKHDPQRITYLTPHLPFLDAYSHYEAQRALEFFDKYCPGLMEEIAGASDSIGVPIEEIAFMGGKNRETGYSSIPVNGREAKGSQCSHLAILPRATEDGHLYAAQNIDSGPGDLDLRLCTTRVKGKPAHIGFSDMIFGRVQGLNEYGLCVTTSWGAPMIWPPCEGLPYFAVVRALLDRCKTVNETLETLATIPVAWCTNFIVSDPGGEAALIEVAGTDRHTIRIGKNSATRFLCATNHYTFPGLDAYNKNRRRESIVRRRAIESRVESAAPLANKEIIRNILSDAVPGGVCLHHYSSGLGTLWSMIFDVTDKSVEVCFGAPSSPGNVWRTFGMQDSKGSTEYQAQLPDTPAPKGLWERVPPDTNK